MEDTKKKLKRLESLEDDLNYLDDILSDTRTYNELEFKDTEFRDLMVRTFARRIENEKFKIGMGNIKEYLNEIVESCDDVTYEIEQGLGRIDNESKALFNHI